MPALLFLILLCLLALATPVEADEPLVEVLGPGVYTDGEGTHRLQADTRAGRPFARPQLLVHLPGGAPADDRGHVYLEVEGEAEEPGAMEAFAVYGGVVRTFAGRREGASRVRWYLPRADDLTSVTLAWRDAPAVYTLDRVRLHDGGGMPVGERLLAAVPHPLLQPAPGRPVIDGTTELELLVPGHLVGAAATATLELEFRGADGQSVVRRLALLEEQGAEEGAVALAIRERLPSTLERPLMLEVRLEDGRAAVPVGTVLLEENQPPTIALGRRSITDFAVVERNGEIGVYLAATDPGLQQPGDRMAYPARSLWLVVGDGRDWYVEERLVESDLWNVGWSGLSALRAGAEVVLVYTESTPEGVDALAVARGLNTFRLRPSARNPVWVPEDGTAAPFPADNALLSWRGALLLNRLEDGGLTQLSGPIPTRWSDLGPVGLALSGNPRWMSAFAHGGMHYFLVGLPRLAAFATVNPIRNPEAWRRVEVDLPGDWEKIEVVAAGGRLHAFGLVERAGHGVIEMREVTMDETGLREVEP